jgi:hypothetical protein
MAEIRPEMWLPQASAGEPGGGGGEQRGTDEPAAPSIGPHTQIEHTPPEERLAGREHSNTDALGLDKRRQVVGGTYGPTRTRVIMRFVVFFAVVGALFVGLLLLVDQLDQPPDTYKDTAPWTGNERPPDPIQ